MSSSHSREHIPLTTSLWRLIIFNGRLKILSILFSGVIFLMVRTQQVREFPRLAKIHIVTSDSLVVIGSAERVIDVTVRLPETLFSRQPTDDELVGELDISKVNIGKIRVRLSRENFPLLDKRYQLIISDPWIEIDLDAMQHKKVAVRAVLQGLPKEGLAIESVNVTPEMIEVSGPKRIISRIETLSTSAINIENIDQNFSSLSKIVIDEASSLKLAEEKVNVQVIVGAKKVIRAFHAVPVEINIPGKFELRPSHVEVEIQGQKEVLDGLKPSDVRAFLDTEEMGAGWQEKRLKLKIPAGTSLVRVSPDSVSVQIIGNR